MNSFKTFLLMFFLVLLFGWIGEVIGGRNGMILALIFAGITNLIMYWFSDKIVLTLYGAKKADEGKYPGLYKIIKDLTTKANMPLPKVYTINQDVPNAFATGRNPSHSAVAVTTGILEILNKDELTGVVGHELSHIKNRDILIATIAATFAGAIMMLSRMAQFAAYFDGRDSDGKKDGNPIAFFVLAILAPIAALLIQMAISRSREYIADESSGKLTGNPLALASALRKLEDYAKKGKLDANPATAHMFIVNPLKGESILSLFSTHPPVSKRAKKLEELAYKIGEKKYQTPNVVY